MLRGVGDKSGHHFNAQRSTLNSSAFLFPRGHRNSLSLWCRLILTLRYILQPCPVQEQDYKLFEPLNNPHSLALTLPMSTNDRNADKRRLLGEQQGDEGIATDSTSAKKLSAVGPTI